MIQQLMIKIAPYVYATNFNIGEAGQGYIPHATGGNYESNFWNWIGSLISMTMPIAALLVLGLLLWGAFEWITSEGDSGKLTKARQKMVNAVIGIIVLSSTLAIFALVQQFLGVCLIKYGQNACSQKSQTGKRKVKCKYTTIQACNKSQECSQCTHDGCVGTTARCL